MSTDFSADYKTPAEAPFVQPVGGGLQYSNISASAVVKASAGNLAGFHVNSSSSGTVKLWDNASAGSGTVLINTYSPSVGWNPCPFRFRNGLYATLGGTIDLTFSFT